MINEVINKLDSGLSSVVVTAPTNKAKQVIASKVSGIDSLTVHQLLGFQPNFDLDNFDINNISFIMKGAKPPAISQYKFVIIDEASMLNSDLLNYIIDRANMYNSKVLLVGDKFQIPPVNEDTACVFELDLPKMELKTIVRQANNNPIAAILLAIRHDLAVANNDNADANLYFDLVCSYGSVMNKINSAITKSKLKSNWGNLTRLFLKETDGFTIESEGELIGFDIVRDVIDFRRRMIACAKKAIITDFKYLAFTNNNVNNSSKILRERCTIDPNNTINIGDWITGYKTKRIEDMFLIENGVDYTVIDVEKRSVNNIEVSVAKLKSATSNVVSEVYIVDRTIDNYYEYLRFERNLFVAAKNRNISWINYYDNTTMYVVLDNLNEIFNEGVIINVNLIDMFFAPKDLPSRDANYGYGVTTHKSQGSTYKEVYVDVSDINNMLKNMDKTAAKIYSLKLLYVAISRAAKKATVYVK